MPTIYQLSCEMNFIFQFYERKNDKLLFNILWSKNPGASKNTRNSWKYVIFWTTK